MDGEEEEELGVEGGGGLLQQQSCTGALMMMLDYYNNKSGFPYSSSDLAFLAGLNCSIEESQPVGETNQFILPWWRTLLWTMLFGVMVIVSTGGNLIVIWIVLADRRMRTVTNYFLVNLSCADTMVSTLNVIFNFTYMVTNDWPFGRIYCKITQYVAVISICGSVFTLMAISIERYLAIMYPLRPRMGKTTTIAIAVFIWVASLLISMPNAMYATTIEFNDTGRTACYHAWPDGPTFESTQEYIYNVLLTILIYFLPICAMGYAYFQVGVELWGSQTIGENTDHQMENIKSKRRVVKMMIVVVTIFACCWLPYHIYFLVSWHFQEINEWEHMREVYLIVYWLAMSNAMYNPIIYCWMNSRFRKGFLRVFYFWFRCFKPPPGSDIAVSYRNGVMAGGMWNSCPGSPDHPTRTTRNGGPTTMMMLHHLSANDRYERNRHLSAQQQRMAAAATKRAATAAEQQKREEQMQQKQQQEKEEEEELQQQQQPTANGDLGNATCVIATTAAAAPTHPTDDDIFTSTTFP